MESQARRQSEDEVPRRRLPDCRRLPGCEERRAAPRLKRHLPLRFRSGGLRWHEGQSINVSATGARVVLTSPVDLGQAFQVRLALAPDVEPLLRARAVWKQDLAGGRAWIVGIEFEPTWAEDARSMGHWLDREIAREISGRPV